MTLVNIDVWISPASQAFITNGLHKCIHVAHFLEADLSIRSMRSGLVVIDVGSLDKR